MTLELAALDEINKTTGLGVFDIAICAQHRLWNQRTLGSPYLFGCVSTHISLICCAGEIREDHDTGCRTGDGRVVVFPGPGQRVYDLAGGIFDVNDDSAFLHFREDFVALNVHRYRADTVPERAGLKEQR